MQITKQVQVTNFGKGNPLDSKTLRVNLSWGTTAALEATFVYEETGAIVVGGNGPRGEHIKSMYVFKSTLLFGSVCWINVDIFFSEQTIHIRFSLCIKLASIRNLLSTMSALKTCSHI